MAVNHLERAYRAWPILVSLAKNRKTITYGELAKRLNIHHRPVRYLLAPIQDYCIEMQQPPLTILVTNIKGLPGSGFFAYNLDNFEEGKELVFNYPWNELENPFSFAKDNEDYDSILEKLLTCPDESEDIYRKVKVRGAGQLIFRDALLKAYKNKCAFTDISFFCCLEAAHIVPWNQCSPDEKLDIRNGIVLNSLHHKLFDNGYLTIDNEYRIIYSDPNQKDGVYSEFDKLVSLGIHKKFMNLPSDIKIRPSQELIKRHNDILWLG